MSETASKTLAVSAVDASIASRPRRATSSTSCDARDASSAGSFAADAGERSPRLDIVRSIAARRASAWRLGGVGSVNAATA